LVDRHEVTNEEYKKLMQGVKREFWKQPFRGRESRSVGGRGSALPRRDGLPGPSWELGSGKASKHPAAGVSWFEAAAYAEFAGKAPPSTTGIGLQTWASMLIVPGQLPWGGPSRSERGAVSGSGTTDMAGNVKEWCWNETGRGKRFILGGGFGEPTYMFIDQDAQSPWDRKANYGFRCVKLPAPPPEVAARRIEAAFRDFSKEKPVSEEVFRAFRGLYAYDKGDLHARVEETETTEDWTHVTVSFNAAYGGERVIAHLYLPKDAAPPFQTVV
jgi:hypothetical protein